MCWGSWHTLATSHRYSHKPLNSLFVGRRSMLPGLPIESPMKVKRFIDGLLHSSSFWYCHIYSVCGVLAKWMPMAISKSILGTWFAVRYCIRTHRSLSAISFQHSFSNRFHAQPHTKQHILSAFSDLFSFHFSEFVFMFMCVFIFSYMDMEHEKLINIYKYMLRVFCVLMLLLHKATTIVCHLSDEKMAIYDWFALAVANLANIRSCTHTHIWPCNFEECACAVTIFMLNFCHCRFGPMLLLLVRVVVATFIVL